jgi:hexokinase
MPCCCKGGPKQSPLDILESFTLSPETLVDVLDRMDAAMSRGLNSVDDHDIRMFPTYINSVPNSKEKGEFLCMDLGITRLVISLVELRGKRITFKRDSSRAPSSTLIEVIIVFAWSLDGKLFKS